MPSLKDWVGKDLSGFKVIEVTGVYRRDGNGALTGPAVASFADSFVAEAYADFHGGSRYGTHSVLVLTDGIHLLELGQLRTTPLFNSNEEAAKLKSAVLGKLSLAERKLVGL